MVFVGPSIESILEMGLKHRARDLAIAANVPVVPGTALLTSEEDAIDAANKIGFPASQALFEEAWEARVRLTTIDRSCSKLVQEAVVWVSRFATARLRLLLLLPK